MSIVPNHLEIEETLQKLIHSSQALLDCDTANSEQLKQILDEREILIAQLQNLNPEVLRDAQNTPLSSKIERLQSLDKKIEQQFKQTLETQAQELRQIVLNREALLSYKFPTPTPYSGIENEG